MWMAFPGVLVGSTMHFFLSEAMWSGKKNSWGQAWVKAILMNSVLWGAGIGLCTGVWRKVLPLSAAGRRLFYRYPVSSVPLEMRVMRSGKEFFTGMGWSYWLSGVGSGNMAPIILVSFAVYNERPYLIMAPGGGYGDSCMPPWRRDHMARLASPAGEPTQP
ncbi:hypothetical protein STCU_06622 [Strigomonas culicis]|nr:hypothetical protein STCU_06622 [Strigomonas culicis]|eukprot:EPY25621.1 hypothetical protein STCU_06622 [Strigomonas culicis]